MSALKLLAGNPHDFVSTTWGTRRQDYRGDPAALTALLTLDDVDRLLTASALRVPAIRVVQDGRIVPTSRITRTASIAGLPLTGLLDPATALRLFDRGATLVLQGLHRYHQPLAELVAELELELGHPCQANAYLTPASAQGFARHGDTHDVFVVQTVGTKQWQIWEDADQPAPSDVVLTPGDVLYLPTGMAHAARAQHAVSLHVTIGINQVTWGQLLDAAIARAGSAAAAPDRGQHLPAGYLEDTAPLADGLRSRLAALAAALTQVDAQRVVDRHTERFLTARLPRLRGSLVDRVRLEALTDDTMLRRRPGRPLTIVPDGDQLTLLLGDHSMRVPSRISPAIEAIAASERLRPADLCAWLDAPGRLVLCRRLVREGVLEFAE